MVQLLYSEIKETKKSTPETTNLQNETFRENYDNIQYNTLSAQLQKDNKYDYAGNVLLYNTPLPPSLTDVYNSDLTTKFTQQNQLYIACVISMGVLLISAISLARN